METKRADTALDKLFASGKYAQRAQYPCGCELLGPAPLPEHCPTHGQSSTISTAIEPVLVAVVLDESGSMSSCRSETIAGYNEYLHGLREDATPYLVTLAKFDLHPGDPTCRIMYANKPIQDAPQLTEDMYAPRGSTPLYDAIGTTIRAIEAEANNRAVLMLILTDGQENASHEFTKTSIRELIKAKEATGNWTFVYLGANQDAWAVGQQFGMAQGNVHSYSTTNMRPMMANLARASRSYAASAATARRAGQPMATASFFKNSGIRNIEADPAAAALGRRGGQTRMRSLAPGDRKKLAQRAADARWKPEPRT